MGQSFFSKGCLSCAPYLQVEKQTTTDEVGKAALDRCRELVCSTVKGLRSVGREIAVCSFLAFVPRVGTADHGAPTATRIRWHDQLARSPRMLRASWPTDDREKRRSCRAYQKEEISKRAYHSAGTPRFAALAGQVQPTNPRLHVAVETIRRTDLRGVCVAKMKQRVSQTD